MTTATKPRLTTAQLLDALARLLAEEAKRKARESGVTL
jgi:hypothetical protein